MSTCALLPTFSPLGEKSLSEEDPWLEQFLDFNNFQEYEENFTMRRSLRINEQQLKSKSNSDQHQHGKKRRKSLDLHLKSDNTDDEEEEEETPKIPTSKFLTSIAIRKGIYWKSCLESN